MSVRESGRRQDEVLRVIDDDPRVFGVLRPKSILFLMSFFAFTWGLARLGLFGLLVGRWEDWAQMGLSVLAFVVLRYVEQYENVNWIPWVIRFYVTGRTRRIFSGGSDHAFNAHGLEDLLLWSRLRGPAEIGHEA